MNTIIFFLLLALIGVPGAATAEDALVILNTGDIKSFHEAIAIVRDNGGEVPQAYPPNAFVATLNSKAEWALSGHPAVHSLERGSVDLGEISSLGKKALTAAGIWNAAVHRATAPAAKAAPFTDVVPEQDGPDFLIAPPPPEKELAARAEADAPAGAPSADQTSEFMAGTTVYSVVFVESNGGSGNCSPADTETEDWSASQRAVVLSEISEGLEFWSSRPNSPRPLTFMMDDLGTIDTSCEPITRPSSDQGLWMADTLTAVGFPATPSDYHQAARSLADSRRKALGADWGFLIFVVNSDNAYGEFADGLFAYAYLNGPLMVMTYRNSSWGISRMSAVTAHETGHIFGALDEYAESGCKTSHRWGYLNAPNDSCNNGGNTNDISIMGGAYEMKDPDVDVSTSARDAIGWRHPAGTGGKIVDVIRASRVTLKAYTPDPTKDRTPTYTGTAVNPPFPPGSCDYPCFRVMPRPTTITKVRRVQWSLDGRSFTTSGVRSRDGAFNERVEGFTFTPRSNVSVGRHKFTVRSTNNFGYTSRTKSDRLTIRR